MSILDTIAAAVEAATAMVNSAASAISDFGSAGINAASAALSSATSTVSSYVDSGVSSSAGSYIEANNTVQQSINYPLSYTLDAWGNIVSSGQNYLTQQQDGIYQTLDGAGNMVFQSLDSSLSDTEGILTDIREWIEEAIKGAIAIVSEAIKPISLSIESLLSFLVAGISTLGDKITSIPDKINNKLEELLTVDEKEVEELVKKYKRNL